MPTLAINKKAKHDYEIIDTFEAGLVLLGHEVKSVRGGGLSLQGAYAAVRGGEAWLIGAHIRRYSPAGRLEGYDPERTRKLLLRRRELQRLIGKLQEKRLTLVPISVYTRGSKIKVELGLARGKKQYEKREALRKRDLDRELRRSLKG
jgi:SsrA-binding protein